MKIESLRFQAFGPYVDEQCIDFTQLQDHLFLIRGETGAGKTVILDAITYAIYGYSSGGDRGELEGMRCRFASQDTITFVECIVCIHHHRYRFYRQVEVYKKRNDERSYRTKIDGGELLADGYHPFFENCKQRLLEEKAQQLIGLNHAQFIQVMMLPQGKFEQLLVSSSEEKQEILKSLFQVEKWADICEYLVEKAKVEKDTLEQMRIQIQLLLQQSKIETMEEFNAVLQEAMLRYEEEQQTMKDAHQRYQDVVKQLQVQSQLHVLQKRYDTFVEEKRTLTSQQEQMDTLAKQIEQYTKYLQVKPYYDAMKQGKQQVQIRTAQIEEIEHTLIILGKKQEEVQGEEERLRPFIQEIKDMKEDLAYCQKEYEHFEQSELLQKELEKLLRSINVEQDSLFDIQKQQQACKDECTLLSDENKTLEGMLQSHPKTLRKVQLYDTAYSIHLQSIQNKTQITKLLDILKTQEIQVRKALDYEKKCEQEHEMVYQHFLDHSADVLAQSLIEGSPCPVCGSTHHPLIAQEHIATYDVHNLRERKQALTDASKTTQDIHEQMQVTQSQLDALRQQTSTLDTQILALVVNGYDEQIHMQLKQTCIHEEKCLQKRLDNIQKLEELTVNLQRFEQASTNIQEKLQQLQQEVTIVQTKLAERKQKSVFSDRVQLLHHMEKQQAQVLAYEEEMVTNTKSIQEIHQSIAIQKAARMSAKQELQMEQERYQNAYESYTKQAVDELQGNLEDMDMQEAISTLQKYEQRCVEVDSVLQQLALQRKNTALLNLDTLQKQVEEEQTNYQVLAKIVATYESQIQNLKENETAVKKLQKKWEKTLGTYEQLNSFVKVMRGDNSIGIERYVLGAMLSQITQVANALLTHVHNGRYRIYRSDETRGRVRKFGLELSIYDSYSCSQRSVISLSGGEKFLVSLALSLALSTVVQARSGGIHLETMFIDEGFGSLDEQSIADALQVLSSMGKQKAMIGIISHVELLKENIPYGIYVKKQREGSEITLLR